MTGRPVQWSSSLDARATVSATGLVTAVSPGAVEIFATIDGRTGSAALTILTADE